MSAVNTNRLLLGGVAAGLVVLAVEGMMNTVVLVDALKTMMEAHNLPPLGSGAIAGFVAMAFLLGIATVWLYAAIRPRYGEGPATALRAAAAAWVFFYGFGIVASYLMGFFGVRLLLISLVYSLPTMLAAGYVGGMLYKEG